MKKLTRLTLLLLLITPCLTMAQKKELSQARTILKSGKNFGEAEKLMTELLKDSANRDNKRIYAVWYESVMMQYQAVNEQLYLKQKQDTAQFYELTRRLFSIAETLDSLDMKPNRTGKVDLEYRKSHAEQLMKYRPNLFYASAYFVRKADFKNAYAFCEAYLDCVRQPLFSDYQLEQTDARIPEAAYWATYCGYRMADPVLTLRYREQALRDTAKAAFTLQYMAEARRWLKDDSLYVETLTEGFHRYPQNAYFFPRLMDYYTTRSQYDEALQTADYALEANDTSTFFLYAKAAVLFNLERYDESIALSDTLIAMNNSLPEPYYNAGTCYLNKALQLHPLREKKQMRQMYQKARPYMECYRQLAPSEKQKWGPALYRIYLNLNLGKQFDEIDRLLKK